VSSLSCSPMAPPAAEPPSEKKNRQAKAWPLRQPRHFHGLCGSMAQNKLCRGAGIWAPPGNMILLRAACCGALPDPAFMIGELFERVCCRRRIYAGCGAGGEILGFPTAWLSLVASVAIWRFIRSCLWRTEADWLLAKAPGRDGWVFVGWRALALIYCGYSLGESLCSLDIFPVVQRLSDSD